MKKRGKMKTRWMSLLLCMSMLLSNVPVTAFAEGETETAVETEVMTESGTEVVTESMAEARTEVVTEAMTEAGTEVVTEAMTEAGTEAMTESETSAETESEGITEKEETVEKDVTDQAAEEQKAAADAAKVAQVQALADALPDTVTLENKEETGNQLNALIAAYGNLESTLQAQIDLTKYDRVLAAMYELEGMSGAQEPQLLADSYLRVYDRVVAGSDGYVDGLVFRATNSNGEVKEIKNGDALESMGFRPDRTYSCTLIKNTTGYNYEAEDSFTINRGSNSSGTANLYVYRQHDLTVTVKDSLNNIVPNAKVTLNISGGGKRTSTTNASGVVIFDKIRGLYTVTASVSYTKENGETGTITSNEIYMKPGNQSVTLTIPRETKVSVKVSGYSDDFLMDNDVGNATVTVQNSRNESVTLTHGSDGNYTGLIKRTSSGIESFNVSVSANGYKDSTTTVSSFGGSAISTTVKLNMKDYQVNGISNNQQMSTGEKYNVSVIPTDMPEDWTLEVWDKDDGFDITKANGTWTIVPKKSGTFTLQFDLQGIVNESPVVMVLEEFKISVRKGTTTYPNAPSIGKEDTDVTTETFTLPSDIKLAQKLTVKAKDTTSGSVLKEQEFTDLTPGKKISMKLKDTVVQGKIHYTFTYFSDAVTYEGTVSTSEKAYYKSISDITVGATTLEYNGQAQHPQVSCSGEYVIKTGYNFLNIEEFFTECETSIPNENNSVIWDIGIGNPSPVSIDQYVLKITGDESKFYKGTESFTYTIVKRPITLTVRNQDITYGSSISSGNDAVTVSAGSIASGHVLSLTATPSTNAPTQNGSIKVSDVKISDGGNDVTKHYSVTVDNNPATLTISKISMDRIQVDVPESVVYNGTEQTPLVVTLDGNTLKEGQDYTAEYKNNKNAGTVEVTVSAAAWEENVTRTFEIQKKSLAAEIQNADKVYDGEKTANNASIVLSGIYAPDDIGLDVEKLVISYLDANAGEEKEVRASNMELTGEAAGNYQLIDADGNVTNTISGKGSISKRTVIVTADNLQKTYGQEDPALTWKHNENIVEGEELTGIHINRAAGENAGDYKITVSQSENANSNYEITFLSGTFTIQPKELTVTVDNLDKQYDGLNGATFSSALNGIVRNDKIELDSTGVTAKFSDVSVGEDIDIIFEGEFKLLCDETTAGNYYLTQPAGIKADIYNEYEAMEYMVSPDSWTNDNVFIIPEEGYLISTENVDGEGKWVNVLTFDVSTPKEGQEITFYLRNMETKAISLPKTVTYYIDKINPVGTITLAGKSWMELLNNITFGMFFNEMKTVTIEAEDDLSGIASVEYYESDKALSQSELESVTEWQLYNGTVDITLEDAKKFVYYAKLTDIAGNITYLSTDGAVYDTTAPAIEGVEEKEYCTTQTVTVTDVNLDKITVNESDVTSPFKLAGDVEET